MARVDQQPQGVDGDLQPFAGPMQGDHADHPPPPRHRIGFASDVHRGHAVGDDVDAGRVVTVGNALAFQTLRDRHQGIGPVRRPFFHAGIDRVENPPAAVAGRRTVNVIDPRQRQPSGDPCRQHRGPGRVRVQQFVTAVANQFGEPRRGGEIEATVHPRVDRPPLVRSPVQPVIKAARFDTGEIRREPLPGKFSAQVRLDAFGTAEVFAVDDVQDAAQLGVTGGGTVRGVAGRNRDDRSLQGIRDDRRGRRCCVHVQGCLPRPGRRTRGAVLPSSGRSTPSGRDGHDGGHDRGGGMVVG